jgi:catechol 2,3-dioxygenase-like lactoylglutathione lyase family enzyme
MTTSAVQLRSTVPVVPVSDITEAMDFYRDKLGFAIAFQQGDYAGVTRDGAHLHLDGVVNKGAGLVTCRVETDGIDDLYTALEAQGVIDPDEPIRDTPWGSRQFSALDCCGNRLTFVRSS